VPRHSRWHIRLVRNPKIIIMKILDTLETIQWAQDNFGSFLTGGQYTKRDVLRAIKKGYVTSVGMVKLFDVNGFMLDHRQPREGFILTQEGRDFLSANMKGTRCQPSGSDQHDGVNGIE